MQDLAAPSDLQLLSDYAQQRSEAAFRALVDRHARWVFAAAYRQLRDRHLAEDVTQTVFLLLSRRAHVMRSNQKLSGWLFNTLHYAVNNARRAAMRREIHEHRAALQNAPSISPPTHHDDLAAQLDAAVHTLFAADRTAILLRFYQNLSFEQIAQSLNLTEAAARKRVTRAVSRLRKRLGTSTEPNALSVAAAAGLAGASPTLAHSIAQTAFAAKSGSLPAGTLAAMKGTASLIVAAKVKAGLVVVATSLLLAAPVAIIAIAAVPSSPKPPVVVATAPAAPPIPGMPAPLPSGFEETYGLRPGVPVRRISPPFPDVRMEYYVTRESRQAAAIPRGPDSMIIGWDHGQPRTWSMHFDNGLGGYVPLDLFYYVLDLAPEEIEGLELVGNRPIRGDYILDLEAPIEKRRAAMEAILTDTAGMPITLTFKQVPRKVTVLSGKWQRKSPDGTPLDKPTDGTIQIYGEEFRTTSVSGSGPVDVLARAIGSWIKSPVVIETQGAPVLDPVSWHTNDIINKGAQGRAKSHDRALVLQHIEEQTGLTPSEQTRTVRRLIIGSSAAQP